MNIWELHPALVHFPLTMLLSSTALELVAFRSRRETVARLAFGMLAAGLISIPIVATAGLIAYFTVPAHTDAANVRMIVHALIAVSAAILYGLVFLGRRRARGAPARPGAMALSVIAALVLTAAGGLGSYLVYHDGVGVVPATPTLKELEEGSVSLP